MKFNSLPRVRLAALPTPLQPLPHLTKYLGGPEIWIKRDDLTGLAFGGNKARKLEYLMADAVNSGADVIVTGAGYHSNWCTQTAAAAKKLGIEIKLVKSGPREGYEGEQWDGNHLLHRLFNADITVVKPDMFQPTLDKTMEQLREQGRHPYFIPVGGSVPLGAAGYYNAVLELTYQSAEEGIQFDYLVHGTGSGGTQAGLVMGAKALNTNMKIIGAAVGWGERQDMIDKVKQIVEDSRTLFELDFNLEEGDITVYNEYVGGGYGVMSPEKAEAVKLLAELEGICIDPVYTAVAMACLIDLVRKNGFRSDQKIVFLHTGGAVALFPYREALKAYMEGKEFPWKVPEWSPLSE